MKYINISTKKKPNIFVLVDSEDFEILNKFKWYPQRSRGTTFYAARRLRHHEGIKRGIILMHRQIMKPKSKMQVDHIDGNSLNNCKENLRICTNSENNMNKKKTKFKSFSKYKGVIKSKSKRRYMAQIMVNYKHISLGYFDTEKEAAITYNKAAIKYHGEFASLNVIEND